MGRKRNKSSNKRKPKLMFTESPASQPIGMLCSPVCGVENPVKAARIFVNDIENLSWVSPQFNSQHFAKKNKCRRQKKKTEDEARTDKKVMTHSKKFGKLQFDEVCMSKQLGNNGKIGLELTFKKQRRRKTVKGDLSDVSEVELSDYESTSQDDYPEDLNLINITEFTSSEDDHTKLKEKNDKVLAYDTPERDYGINAYLRRRRDLLPPYARQKLMNTVIK